MKTDDFDYNLPEELIAQTPLENRSSSRLLVVNREKYDFTDHYFSDIINYLNPGDALVLNETKVLPARIFGTKTETGGTVELLLLKDLGDDTWECLARPQKRLHPGTKITFDIENFTAEIVSIHEEGITHVKFSYSGIFLENIEKLGTMPLPPYIHEQLDNQSRYQTVYAKNLGSAAAPTAGLHFTEELLEKIKQKGIKIVKITLHVGLGTFRPVQVSDIKNHQMHTETYEMSEEAAKTLNQVKKSGGRVFAVGTTSVRTLETIANLSSEQKNQELFHACHGETSIFIYPGYKFLAVDSIITNFHLPKSTLLMLVSAFADQTNQINPASQLNQPAENSLIGRDLILDAYYHAIKERYRFFSFGDAMLII